MHLWNTSIAIRVNNNPCIRLNNFLPLYASVQGLFCANWIDGKVFVVFKSPRKVDLGFTNEIRWLSSYPKQWVLQNIANDTILRPTNLDLGLYDKMGGVEHLWNTLKAIRLNKNYYIRGKFR